MDVNKAIKDLERSKSHIEFIPQDHRTDVESATLTALNQCFAVIYYLQARNCVFCHEKDLDTVLGTFHHTDGLRYYNYIRCNNCKAQGPIAETLEEAYKAWNR